MMAKERMKFDENVKCIKCGYGRWVGEIMKFEFMSTRAHRSKCHEANEEWLKVICPRCKWEGRMDCMDTVWA
jgi:hypothetical protein